MVSPRMTPQTIAVLKLLLSDPTTPRYGLDIALETGLKTGTVHPILARLQGAGLIESFWEEPAEHEDQGRPRRRYYQFTGHGATTLAHQAVARADAATTSGRAGLRPQPGY
jgi:PadR family transcriptional regulator, regulatory protein PadR